MQSSCNNESAPVDASVAVERLARPSDLPRPSDEAGAERRVWLDRLGVGVSITCAIHCVGAALLAAAPAFAASTAPALGEGLEWLEGALLWIALGVGSIALVPSYLREHRNALPLILFVLGIGVIALVRSASDALEIAGTVTGVALVASAHLVNLRSRGRLHVHDHSRSH